MARARFYGAIFISLVSLLASSAEELRGDVALNRPGKFLIKLSRKITRSIIHEGRNIIPICYHINILKSVSSGPKKNAKSWLRCFTWIMVVLVTGKAIMVVMDTLMGNHIRNIKEDCILAKVEPQRKWYLTYNFPNFAP